MDILSTYDLEQELDELEAREADIENDDDPLDEDERERLGKLRELRDEVGSAWGDEGLIPEDDFEDYAQQLAEDIGAINPDAGWPANCIDWKQAARELAMDYTTVTFDGTDYYYRAS